MKKGDNNTGFFHRLTDSQRRANHVGGIEVDSVLYEEWGFEFPREFKFDSYKGEMGI